MFILVILQQFVINLASKLSRSNENMPLNNVTSYLFYTVFSINEGLKTQKKRSKDGFYDGTTSEFASRLI